MSESYIFNIKDAVNYGVNEAIILYNFRHWIKRNKANKKNIKDGKVWTYNSANAFTELFPFWSERQVRRILKSLIDKGLLEVGNYNKHNYDKTSWYTLTKKAYDQTVTSMLPNGQMEVTKRSDGSDQTVRPIPDINTNINTNVNKYNEQHKNAAIYLAKHILKNDSNFSQLQKNKYYKTIQRWADDIRKIEQIDNRNMEEIKKIIDFAMNDNFWKSNILSGLKLRKQFDRLIIQLKSKKTKDKKSAWVERMKQKYEEAGRE